MANLDSLIKRLTSYADESEGWLRDHKRAMECMDLELHLQNGLSVLEAIHLVDEHTRSQLYDDPSNAPLAQRLSQVRSWLETWHAQCSDVVVRIDQFESEFGHVEYAAEFRKACKEVADILDVKHEWLLPEKLAAVRDAAVDAFRRGDCEAWDQ